MSIPGPYLRTLTVGAVWFAAIALKMVSRHPGHWSTYPPRNLVVLVFAWLITALLLGVAATRFEKLRSWWGISLGTVAGSFLTLIVMLLGLPRSHSPSSLPDFKSTDAMMLHFATEATKWVQKDRGIDLDYSVDSIRVIEEELDRISKEIDKDHPQRGTFGLALGYGGYVGEVFRRGDGGFWAADHPTAGPRSFPLTTKSNTVIFPVGWCWKRLTSGAEENVYHKAMLLTNIDSVITNATEFRRPTR